MTDITQLLAEVERGAEGSAQRLAALLYDELRVMARREMAAERPDHTLQPTARVHEAYLRLVGDAGASFDSRAHFFSAAANAIRRVLVEHARRRGRLKRGGDRIRIDFDNLQPMEEERDERVLALDEALQQLEELDPDKARLVELRFFAGMSVEEAAQALKISESTAARNWRMVRAWLQGALTEPEPDGP